MPVRQRFDFSKRAPGPSVTPMTESIGSPLLYGVFTALVMGMLALDLGVFHHKAHEVRFKEALAWSAVWVGLAVAFNVWLGATFGAAKGLEFTTGYLIEKALSVDNVFIFLVIFSSFAVPSAYQHRVLFWGVVGALLFRALFIAVGAAVLEAFHGVIYVFAAILLVTGIKLLRAGGHEEHPERNPVFRWLSRVLPSTSTYHGQRFFVVEAGRRVVTPLFLVLVLIEITDVIFAIDSVPAIFAVTDDPFIVYTSNIFAILGLRSLYFCISGFVGRLKYLKVGLAFVLIFVAVKMLIAEFWKIPIGLSLGMIAAILTTSVVASLWATRGAAPPPERGEGH